MRSFTQVAQEPLGICTEFEEEGRPVPFGDTMSDKILLKNPEHDETSVHGTPEMPDGSENPSRSVRHSWDPKRFTPGLPVHP